MKIKLSVVAVQSAFNALVNTEPKGRVEVRLHSKVYRLLEKSFTSDAAGVTAQEAEAEFESSLFDYLKTITHKRVDIGVPGVLAKGYSDLLEQFEHES